MSFSLGTSVLSPTVTPLLMSCMVASMRISSPNFAYWPQTTRSAVLKSATRRITVGSSTVVGEIRKSENIWCRRSGLTVCNCEDCPTSVLNISARLEPNQSKLGSPEAFLKGRIANETAGTALGRAEDDENSLSRNRYPPIASKTTINPAVIDGHGMVRPHGPILGSKLSVAPARLPCHVSRSAKSSAAVLYRSSRSRSKHLVTISLSDLGIVSSWSETGETRSWVRLIRLAIVLSALNGICPV